MNPTLYLVDGSSYIFRAFFALPLLTNSSGLPTNAIYGFTQMLIRLLKEEQPKRMVVVFDSGRKTFRNDLYVEYKGNRPEAPQELVPQFSYIRRVVGAMGITQAEMNGFEADDIIGTLVDQHSKIGCKICIITGDKDLMQLVGPDVTLLDTMKNKRTGVREVEEKLGVPPEQVVDMMALAGDPIDNIPGIRGIGEKTASLLIREFGTLEGLLASLDRLNGKSIRGAARIRELLNSQAEQALMSRELARIRRDVPISLSLEEMAVGPPDQKVLGALFQELEFQQLFKDWSPDEPKAETETVFVENQKTAESLATRLDGSPQIAIVPLLTGHPEQKELVGLALSVDPTEGFFVPKAAALPDFLKDPLESKKTEKIGHDLKKSILVLEREGVHLAGPLFDTMVASYLINPGRSHDLESVALDVLGQRPEGRPSDSHQEKKLASEQACLIFRLKAISEEQLAAQDSLGLFRDIEMPLVRVLSVMERIGVKIDVPTLVKASSDWQEEMSRLMEEIHAISGTSFNVGSPPQLRQVLFERLQLPTKGVRKGKTGYSTDNDVLTRLSKIHPLPKKILEYRSLAKLKSTYGDALPPLVDPATGRIHTSFNQTVAATGRLSSSNPNLQNIPIRTQEGRRIRQAFIAEEGFLLLSADYSQMELRLMAHLSGDPILQEAFHRDEDIHTRTASEVFHLSPKEVDAEQRRRAKTINFGMIYGMGAQKLSQELEIPKEEAEDLLKRYFARYRGVKDYMEKCIEEARRLGYVSTLFNRRRQVPEIQSSEGGVRQAAERIAMNTPVQGSAADIIKVAMVRIHRKLEETKRRSRMILQVHDELVFEVAEEEREEIAQLAKKEMEGVVSLRVPLKVDLFFGHNWAEAH